jgi:Zn-dependent peptidase ImmA (M78 family)
MRLREFAESTNMDKQHELKKFVRHCIEQLELSQGMPKIEFSNDKDMARGLKTMGFHDSDNNLIWIYVGKRNLADIMRTTAHELVHAKQREEGRLDDDPHAGTTGSEIENEANSKAGIIMRNYGQNNPHIFESHAYL